MKKIFCCLALFTILFCQFKTAAYAPPAPLVLISIDGLKPDYVLQADKYSLKIPNLRRFLTAGIYADGVTGVLPTYTYPSHTTIVTGVEPNKHGIFSNFPYDPQGKNLAGWNWYAEDIRVPTLWDMASKAGLTTASVDWPVTVGAKIDYKIVQYWRAANHEDVKLIRALSTPGLLTEAEQAVGPYPDGYDYTLASDERRLLFNKYILETKHPQLLFTYFGSLDEEEHAHGPDTPAVFATLEAIDKLVGQLRDAAQQATGGRAIICVVSDHGFARSENEISLNSALRAADLIKLDENGKVTSWQAYAWNTGGVAAIILQNPNDETLINKTGETLKNLAANPDNGISQVMTADEFHRLGGFAPASFLVCAKPGYHFGRNFQGQVVRHVAPVGVHGYLASMKEMNSAFFLARPTDKIGKNIGQIDMRDIAPTLAGLLNIELPEAQGKNLLPK
jgi:predicted AlkP superfamily pyrophosphatase or phosphodiesterase